MFLSQGLGAPPLTYIVGLVDSPVVVIVFVIDRERHSNNPAERQKCISRSILVRFGRSLHQNALEFGAEFKYAISDQVCADQVRERTDVDVRSSQIAQLKGKNAYLGQFWSDLDVLYIKTH